MAKLILHPTDISQWHALVNEAEALTRLMLPENAESYLVFLLMRFINTSSLLESVVAIDLLESMQACGKRQVDLLKDVGDKSLLFSGLFPGIAEKRHLNLEYFVDMGKSAYFSVGEMVDETPEGLYYVLSERFVDMQKVLQAMQTQYLEAGFPTAFVIKDDPDPIQ